jgi:hypothetical protein
MGSGRVPEGRVRADLWSILESLITCVYEDNFCVEGRCVSHAGEG